MAVYHVKANNCGYDEYDGFIVVARDAKQALAFVLIEVGTENFMDDPTITEVDLTNRGILLGSFNAG